MICITVRCVLLQINELNRVNVHVMLMPDDFKSYSKIRVDNHMFNKLVRQREFFLYCSGGVRIKGMGPFKWLCCRTTVDLNKTHNELNVFTV